MKRPLIKDYYLTEDSKLTSSSKERLQSQEFQSIALNYSIE